MNLRSRFMIKCRYDKKSFYWASIAKKIMAMNDDQLVILYDIHRDFLLETEMNKDNQIRRYNSFKELTYNRLVRYTWETNYPALRQVVDLILAGYDYCKVVEIVFAVLPPWARNH